MVSRSSYTIAFEIWHTRSRIVPLRSVTVSWIRCLTRFTLPSGQTVTFTTTEGAEVSFTVVDVEGVDNQIDVTLNDTVIRLSLVDMNTLQ